MSNDSSFWGPVTSTIDWCEPNYKISPFIAEPANTLSNLSFVILGLIGALHESSQAQAHQSKKAYAILYTTVALIGVGSMLFHGTLRVWGQQMDELPMVWYLLMCMYVVNHDYIGGNPMIKSISNILLPVYALVFSVIHMILKTTTAFQIHFGIMVSIVLLRMHQRFRDVDSGPQGRKVIQMFFTTGLSGFLFWLIDYHYCNSLFHPEIGVSKMSSIVSGISNSNSNSISYSFPNSRLSKPWRLLQSLSSSSLSSLFSVYPLGHTLWHLLIGYCAFCFVTMLKILESHQMGKKLSLTVFYKYGIIPLTYYSNSSSLTTDDDDNDDNSNNDNTLRLNIVGGNSDNYDNNTECIGYASGNSYGNSSSKISMSTKSSKSISNGNFIHNSSLTKDLEMF